MDIINMSFGWDEADLPSWGGHSRPGRRTHFGGGRLLRSNTSSSSLRQLTQDSPRPTASSTRRETRASSQLTPRTGGGTRAPSQSGWY